MTQTDLLEELKMEQVKTKQRVTDHGEVFTSDREVNAMLDLVKNETLRIESRFLEPACGTGNFLVEILRRKLIVVSEKYRKNKTDFERYSFEAIASIYGVDLLEDNIEACRKRLFDVFDEKYLMCFKRGPADELSKSIKFILKKNIIYADALSLKTVDTREPIVFCEWSFINPRQVKRKDYVFEEIIPNNSHNLFIAHEISDEGKPVFIPEWIKEFAPTHYRELFLQDGDNK